MCGPLKMSSLPKIALILVEGRFWYSQVWECTNTHTHILVCFCKCAYVCIPLCIHLCVFMCMHLCIYKCVYVLFVCVCVRVHVYLCVCVYMCVSGLISALARVGAPLLFNQGQQMDQALWVASIQTKITSWQFSTQATIKWWGLNPKKREKNLWVPHRKA